MAKKNGKAKSSNGTFWGWRRENGRVGVRNHVLILPLDDLSNAACEAVANNIKGTLAIPHAYGRLQFGEDLEVFFRTLIGTGANPNVAACVVIGIEDGWTKRVVDGIAEMNLAAQAYSAGLGTRVRIAADSLREAVAPVVRRMRMGAGFSAYARQKFPGISLEEVDEFLARLRNASGRFGEVRVSPLPVRNCFRISRQTS